MVPLNKIMKKVSVWNKKIDGETTLEQICLSLHFDATKLWLAARKENPKREI